MIGGGSRQSRGHRHDHQDHLHLYRAGYSLASKYTLGHHQHGRCRRFGVQLHSAATLDNYGASMHRGRQRRPRLCRGTITNASATLPRLDLWLQRHLPPAAWRHVTNFGTIQGVGQFGDGVFLTAGRRGHQMRRRAPTPSPISERQIPASRRRRGHGVQLRYDLRQQRQGVYLKSGGSVTNGSSRDTRQPSPAHSGQGVYAKSGRPGHHFGTIRSQETAP